MGGHRYRGPDRGPGAPLQQVRVVPERRARNAEFHLGESGRVSQRRKKSVQRRRRFDRARPGRGEGRSAGKAGRNEAHICGARRRRSRRIRGHDAGHEEYFHRRLFRPGQSYRESPLRNPGHGGAEAGRPEDRL